MQTFGQFWTEKIYGEDSIYAEKYRGLLGLFGKKRRRNLKHLMATINHHENTKIQIGGSFIQHEKTKKQNQTKKKQLGGSYNQHENTKQQNQTKKKQLGNSIKLRSGRLATSS